MTFVPKTQVDVSLLEPGCTDFNQLNDACFILVAPFDIFGRGLYRYTFEGTCKECPDLKIQDGATRIFINTNGTNREDFSEEFLDFMNYITASTDQNAERTSSPKIKLIHQKIRKIKDSEKIGVKFMQQWEVEAYARQEGREEGISQGISQGIQIFIQEFINEGFPKERIIESLKSGFTLSEQEALDYYDKFSK